MTNFEYKEIDEEGMETLDVISSAGKFNEWMYKTILPYCSGNILEIGSGIGNISKFFLSNGSSISLSDIRENYCEVLRKKFGSYTNMKGVFCMDLVHPDFENEYKNFIGTFDTIFALNVVEHIEDHQAAIDNCKKMLRPGGNLIILVPAYQALYNQFDKELFHYRRYTSKSLVKLFDTAKLQIVRNFYFNAAGIMGWYISGKLQKNKTIPKGQMGLYNMLVPIFKLGDMILMNSIGLSVVCVGKKTS